MKRITALFLVTAMFISLVTVIVFAETTMSLDKTDCDAGERMTVTLGGITEQMLEDRAFIAVCKQDDIYDDYINYETLQNVGHNTIKITAPDEMGFYEMRLYGKHDEYNSGTFLHSVPFTVGGETIFDDDRVQLQESIDKNDCNACDRYDCQVCSENGEWFALGDVDGNKKVDIFDALEILKCLIDMDSVITNNPKGSLRAAKASDLKLENPTILCVLEVLKYLIDIPSAVDGVHISGTKKERDKIIVIEIGHRSPDPGAVSGDWWESELNLVAGLEFKRQVERHGFKTFLNRVEWAGIPLVDFYARAALLRPVAGIAFHWNAGGGNGFECYTQTNAMQAKSIELSTMIANEMKEITVLRPNPVRNFNTHPAQYGQNINNLINSIPAPFSYCEMGFIDNPIDRMRFDTVEKQRRYGVQAAKGVLKFLGVSWQE
ncbi:MAG: N-acetylmuramoyl-L-alanine amidase [Oscillospiraceae bacterium]|nr:N-acetylmuramoyl-L-alanine amidase [Oscillospiraceae bacterium]